jgi:hypothetical protein
MVNLSYNLPTSYNGINLDERLLDKALYVANNSGSAQDL